jgi:hypothetical protein
MSIAGQVTHISQNLPNSVAVSLTCLQFYHNPDCAAVIRAPYNISEQI